jgi:hypothetical protein
LFPHLQRQTGAWTVQVVGMEQPKNFPSEPGPSRRSS